MMKSRRTFFQHLAAVAGCMAVPSWSAMQRTKAEKQQALLDDAVVIYRTHRAPDEPRIFYVDLDNMAPDAAISYMTFIWGPPGLSGKIHMPT